jgi:hypothetical protein
MITSEISEIKYKVGTLKKPIEKMSEVEYQEWEKSIQTDAKEYLFSIGQPLVYIRKDGRTVAEHKNGTIEIVR